MFFSDETRIGDTSTPTTYYVDGNIDPNAGQFGWTKADQAHYNQLISYVDSCKEYFEHTQMIAGYVKEAVVEIERLNGLISYIDRLASETSEHSASVKTMHDQVQVWYNELKTLHKSVQDMTAEVRDKYKSVVTLEASATAAADSATNSSGQAIDYYLRTKAMYDEWKGSNP